MKGFPDEVGVLWRDGTPIDLGHAARQHDQPREAHGESAA